MLTVVIPVLNAAAILGPCLAALDCADEIIVIDGGSTDDSAVVANRSGARVIASPCGRGTQLRTGGQAARGDWLLFLHADTRLGAGWREAVAAHAATTPERAGYFDLRLDDAAWQARVIERGVALRVQSLGLPYGDQGLLISRRLYDEVGGFRPLALMEDVDLVRRLGRARTIILRATAVTSAIRYRRDGYVTRVTRNLGCLALYYLRVPPRMIARLYG